MKLAFARVRRQKAKMRQDRPTPAMQVLDSLRNQDPEGRITEEMREIARSHSQSFTVQRLIDKGVVTRLNEKIPKNVQRIMVCKFTHENEGLISYYAHRVFRCPLFRAPLIISLYVFV